MERLKELRTSKGLYQKDIAKMIGVDRTTYVKYENGVTEPNNEMLGILAEIFGVTVDYLLGITDTPSPKKDIYQYTNIKPIQRKKYPLLGEIACGKPVYANEDKESYVMADMDINADFCLIAKGDSMVNARINNGDIVFIREMPIVENGDIAAVIIGDEATLKRVYYYPEQNKLVLNAENPAYEPFVYIDEELNRIQILGKAVYFMSAI